MSDQDNEWDTENIEQMCSYPWHEPVGHDPSVDREMFRRWYEEELRKAKEQAWEEGYDMGVDEEKSVYWDGKSLYPENPYRTESEGL